MTAGSLLTSERTTAGDLPTPRVAENGHPREASEPLAGATGTEGERSGARVRHEPGGRSPSPPPDAPMPAGDDAHAWIELQVLGASGGPLPGPAWVELGSTSPEADAEHIVLRRTDEGGRLRARLEPGTLRAVAWDDRRSGGPLHVELEAGARAPLELRLAPCREVWGRVIDAGTGEPVPGATVSFWTFAERDRVATAPDGTFHHPRFPAGREAQQVRVEAPGYGATVRYLKIEDDGSWKLPAPTASPPERARTLGAEALAGTGAPWIELALCRELRVAGRLVDPAGRPVEAASVVAEGFFHVLPRVASRDQALGQSTDQGAFVLAGLRSDIGHSLVVRAPGFAERMIEVPGGSPGEVEVGEIVLERESVLAGVVVDAEGFPVEDIEVVLTPGDEGDRPAGRRPAAASGGLDVAVRVRGTEERARTRPEGTFLFENLRERSYRLLVQRDDEPLVTLELEPVPGQGFPALELRLPPSSMTLRGEVRGPGGPLPGARVELRRFGSVGTTTTDRSGRFRISGLDDLAPYEISVTARAPDSGDPLVARGESWSFESPVLIAGPSPPSRLAQASGR